MVDGDPARLQQIQVNLLNNAAKYTPRGGHVRLQLAARRRRRGHPRVATTASASPRSMLESVFDLFVQSSRTLDRAEGGLGVGLTLVRSLVALHGGTRDGVERGDRQGERVRRSACRSPPAAAPSRARRRAAGRLRRRGARVVIVEDNEDSRTMLTTYLEAAGLPVPGRGRRTRPGWRSSTRRARKSRSSTSAFPAWTGSRSRAALRRASRASPASISRADRLRPARRPRRPARDAGFDDHLVKPVDLERLVSCLTEPHRADAAGGSTTG